MAASCSPPRWGPDLDTAKAVADRFGIGFVLDYNEPTMRFYGQARYTHGEVKDLRLSREDFAKIRYFKKEDVYEYQQGRYRSLESLARIILLEKIADVERAENKHRLTNKLS